MPVKNSASSNLCGRGERGRHFFQIFADGVKEQMLALVKGVERSRKVYSPTFPATLSTKLQLS